MELKAYQEWVRDSGLFPGSAVGDPKTLNYPIMSLSSESGESLGVLVKMARRLGRTEVHTEDMTPHEKKVMIRELSDALWGITASANQLGVTLEEIASANYEKLVEREKNGELYSSEVSD